MSFGQGAPRWGGEGEPRDENPYGGQSGQSGQGGHGGHGGQPNPFGPAYGQDTRGTAGQPPQQAPYGQRLQGYQGAQGYRSAQAQAPGPGAEPSTTPDWSAMAEASAAQGRRKRWFLIGGIALATCAVGAIVATAVVSAGNGDSDASASGSPAPGGSQALPPLPEPSASQQPSFSSVAPKPPPNPKDFIDSAAKDKAPLSAATLFPGKKLTIGDRTYVKGSTAATGSCAAATQGALGASLTAHGCTQVFRATYSRDGVAVTVGVAVFDKEAEALAVKKQAPQGGVASLSGAGVPTFCRVTVCRTTANSYGRYAYFTVGGFETRRAVTSKDKQVFTAGDDIAEFAFRQIAARGQAQASAAAAAQNG